AILSNIIEYHRLSATIETIITLYSTHDVPRYLLYKYKKTLKDLFEAKPNAHLVKMLEDAIAQYQAVFKAKKEREQKIAELERIVAAGGKVSRFYLGNTIYRRKYLVLLEYMSIISNLF